METNSEILVQLMKNRHQKNRPVKHHTMILLKEQLLLTQLEWRKLINQDRRCHSLPGSSWLL